MLKINFVHVHSLLILYCGLLRSCPLAPARWLGCLSHHIFDHLDLNDVPGPITDMLTSSSLALSKSDYPLVNNRRLRGETVTKSILGHLENGHWSKTRCNRTNDLLQSECSIDQLAALEAGLNRQNYQS